MSSEVTVPAADQRIAELEEKVTMLGYRLAALESKDPVLEMQHVEKHFGGVHAIDNFSVKIEQGQIHGLIGPNGAGKTTIFNNITGIYAPDAGTTLKSFDDDLGRYYEYKTLPRAGASAGFTVARRLSGGLEIYLGVSDRYTHLLAAPQYLQGSGRNEAVLTAGVNF